MLFCFSSFFACLFVCLLAFSVCAVFCTKAEQGEGSMLHIVIFDEIDAICKKRGSVADSTGVSDSVVNQLLSKVDGVDSLNNVLIIGMTNRKVLDLCVQQAF